MSSISRTISELRVAPGLALYLAPMGIKDAVTLQGSLRAGGNYAPKGEPLLPGVLAEMLDEGTKRRSKAAIQEALDARGMSLRWSADGERIRFTGHCRRKDLRELLAILAEEMRKPSFPAANLAVIKKRLIGQLAQREDDTRAQGVIALSRLIYPRGHANRRLTIEEAIRGVRGISRFKLAAFHARTFGRGSLMVVAAGDVRAAEAARAVQRTLAKLPVVADPKRTARIDNVAPRSAQAVITVPKKPSVDLFLATPLSVKKYDPDYYPLLLGARILGVPGFSGRLMRTVREKEGLTYGIYGRLAAFDDEAPGHLEVWGTFAPELLSRGLSSALRELRRLIEKGGSARELADQKTMVSGAHHIGLSTTGGRAGALLTILEDGKSPRYLDSYLADIERVTLSDVNRVMRKYWNPEKLAIAAAGSIAALPKVD